MGITLIILLDIHRSMLLNDVMSIIIGIEKLSFGSFLTTLFLYRSTKIYYKRKLTRPQIFGIRLKM